MTEYFDRAVKLIAERDQTAERRGTAVVDRTSNDFILALAVLAVAEELQGLRIDLAQR